MYICPKCNSDHFLQASFFNKKYNRMYKRSHCTQCEKERLRENAIRWRREHPEREKENCKQWRIKNREHVRDYARKWHRKRRSMGSFKGSLLLNDKID